MKEVRRYKRESLEPSGKHGGGRVIIWGAFQPFVLRILWHYECSKVLSDWCYGKNIEHASPMAICRQVWLHVPKCALIYLLPGVKVLYYILPEGIFHPLETEMVVFSSRMHTVVTLTVQTHTNSLILSTSHLLFLSLYNPIWWKHLKKTTGATFRKQLHNIDVVVIALCVILLSSAAVFKLPRCLFFFSQGERRASQLTAGVITLVLLHFYLGCFCDRLVFSKSWRWSLQSNTEGKDPHTLLLCPLGYGQISNFYT